MCVNLPKYKKNIVKVVKMTCFIHYTGQNVIFFLILLLFKGTVNTAHSKLIKSDRKNKTMDHGF